ncbi:MAG: hypothetical protein ACXVCY_12180 [Pseudobdellovibrionaceae bacterium]
MKLLIFLSLVLSFLSACAPKSSGDSASPSPTTTIKENKTVTVDGPSGTVNLEIGTKDDESVPSLPQQVSVNFENEELNSDHLKVTAADHIEKLLLSDPSKNNYVTLGCDKKVPEPIRLPDLIEADIIEFCGDLQFPLKSAFYKANKIIFNNVQMSPFELNSQSSTAANLFFRAQTIEIVGKNTLTLKGSASQNSRKIPPPLFILAWNFEGNGHLVINALKSYEILEVVK